MAQQAFKIKRQQLFKENETSLIMALCFCAVKNSINKYCCSHAFE